MKQVFKGILNTVNIYPTADHLVGSGTTRVLLGHLSPHNNTQTLAANAVLKGLSRFTQGMDYLLGIAPVESAGGAVIF